MAEPANAIIGETFGTDIPQTKIDETQLAEEKNAARYSKTKEFRQLKEYLEGRIKFFQGHLPNGDPAATQSPEVLYHNWVVANLVIGEFQAVLNFYANAEEAVKDVTRGNRPV